jgi:hypothetical protein
LEQNRRFECLSRVFGELLYTAELNALRGTGSSEANARLENSMDIETTLKDPCPHCARTGNIDFVRRTQVVHVRARVMSCSVEYFVCRACDVEFTSPACTDPLERSPSNEAPSLLLR